MVRGNSGIQNTHLEKHKNYTIKNIYELHRDSKAYKEFKRVPNYGKGVAQNEDINN